MISLLTHNSKYFRDDGEIFIHTSVYLSVYLSEDLICNLMFRYGIPYTRNRGWLTEYNHIQLDIISLLILTVEDFRDDNTDDNTAGPVVQLVTCAVSCHTAFKWCEFDPRGVQQVFGTPFSKVVFAVANLPEKLSVAYIMA